MKVLDSILIVVGILMFVFGNVSFTREKKVVDIGPIEINKKEKKTIAWPNYAGGITVLAGVVILLLGYKKKN